MQECSSGSVIGRHTHVFYFILFLFNVSWVIKMRVKGKAWSFYLEYLALVESLLHLVSIS